jgi:dynein intermediate chain 2
MAHSAGGTSKAALSQVFGQFGDKIWLLQMFERETSREKNLEKAAKEAKIKARKEAGKGNDVVERKMTEADLQQVNLHLPSSAGQGH